MNKSGGITLFTWGYWGWGSATPELVAAAAAIERARGFGPPLFVDVRRLREVRAAGFRGDAFEKVAGRDSCRWMPSLGNPLVGSAASTSVVAMRAEELGGATHGGRDASASWIPQRATSSSTSPSTGLARNDT